MKLCKDCRWIIGDVNNFPKCGHPSAAMPDKVDLVTGKVTSRRWPCEFHRSGLPADDRCGEEGRFWEPKDGDAPPSGFV